MEERARLPDLENRRQISTNRELDASISDLVSEVSEAAAAVHSSDNSREFLHKFVDCHAFTRYLDSWILQNRSPPFHAPFDLVDLQKFDFSLEGVFFQHLTRMPPVASTPLQGPSALLPLEDFIYTAVKALWEAFWDGPFPFSVACQPSHLSSTRDSGLSDLAVSGLGLGSVIVTRENTDRVLFVALLKPRIRKGGCDGDPRLSLSVLWEAVFYAVRHLIVGPTNVFFVLVFDARYGSVVRVEGDGGELRAGGGEDVYRKAAEWVMGRANIAVSSTATVWNDLGNPNWGDIGVLCSLLAVFHSIVQSSGNPLHSIDDLAADHSSRIQARRAERGSGGDGVLLPQDPSGSPEIVELTEYPPEVFEVGSLVWMEASDGKKGYRVEELRSGGGVPYYVASPVGDQKASVFLFVGPHPTQVEQTWQDMVLWYMVQRQAKVLNLLGQKGVSSRNLPELRGYGRVVNGRSLLLATGPVGETVVDMARAGRFGRREAVRCCHDLLSALASAASAGVRHGDVCPENAIFVTGKEGVGYYVLVGWGRAVMEERDRPAMNLHYSSTYSLQEGKLCSGSDTESLVYLLYHSVGGRVPDLDSVEGALQWREKSWSRRIIQNGLGEASPLLKAFADYVDSLCGTPYPIDYDIWLTRFERSIRGDEQRRRGRVEPSGC